MTIFIAILIPLLPISSAFIIGLFGKQLGEQSYKVGVPALVMAFLGSLWLVYAVSVDGPIRIGLPSLSSEAPGWFHLGLFIDRLSAVMIVLITGVSTIIHLFSINYLQGERGYARFYALLGLMTFVILCLVSSANLFMLFVCWQLLSWVLYLLLAYNFSHPPAVDSAFKTLIVHRVGDVAFLGGILLTYHLYGTLEFSELFARAAETATMISLWPGGDLSVSAVTVITLLLFVGAMAKSAQFPLHVWLPDTMDTPTPVSALMHAGIVNAGGFLLNRLAPLYGLSPTTLHVVFAIGMLTVILGASMMLVQNDIKKTLGFSTMAQMGYMIMECGLGAFALAIFHLMAHGLFKATLFLNAGNVIHASRHEPKKPMISHGGAAIPFSRATWITGVGVTLLLPLIILLAAHGILKIPLRDAQGAVIFLFFAWVTASQAMFSLYRLYEASWKVVGVMLLALVMIVFTYLWGAETFTYFLYPQPGVAHQYFQVAALHGGLFDVLVILVTALIILSWAVLYTRASGQRIFLPGWISALRPQLFLLFMNRLYVDQFYNTVSQNIIHFAKRLDHSLAGWRRP
ncbi:NADH-quinone oxidoreductase subunit L [Candidatus Nitronereus thalassa]|uniref:Proton-conducting transporter membrane subunit n=1 Tax=Candidatus Nitronereus thalassa TaxID=3020898 RepID=A0ABU3KAR9_9BACT|nr:proton-conducting transporter membrane subunit [Candidatus Nitronereus thalassa]MDT7043374.1 proton-conducting transporter membrane subunit [Candidatus Nitronereus thalassa]